VSQVVMEATGVYWKPVWQILEDDFELLLVNARHVKQVPGRKTCTLCMVIGLIVTYWVYKLLAGGVLLLIAVLVLYARARRAAEAENAAREEYRTWYEGPPPPLTLPGRFTETWFSNHLPNLHPGQAPMLLDALRARGWSDDKISQMIDRHPHP
jgi:hypothetical protein